MGHRRKAGKSFYRKHSGHHLGITIPHYRSMDFAGLRWQKFLFQCAKLSTSAMPIRLNWNVWTHVY